MREGCSERNLANQVDDLTVGAAIETASSRYDTVACYSQLKRRLLNLHQLYNYARHESLLAPDHFYTWDEARAIVLPAYKRFHWCMAEVARRFFDVRRRRCWFPET